jgi:spore maturation protein CgeB
VLRNEQQKYLYDVTFVGQVHSSRQRRIKELKEHDIEVQCFGKGWKKGIVSNDGMIERFKKSKINLNFTSSSRAVNLKQFAKILLNRRCDNSFQLNSLKRMLNESKLLLSSKRAQIKGRNFEIPGHGGFLLTDYAEHLDQYYIPEKEIIVFHNIDELVENISYYLSHDEEREKIRSAGQQRTLRDHTYEKRFKEIFTSVGLSK